MNFELPMRRVVTESSTKISVLLWAEVYQLKAQNSGRYSCLMSTLPQSLQGRVRDGIIPTTIRVAKSPVVRIMNFPQVTEGNFKSPQVGSHE